jgi:predicted nucleotidyltransferase
MGAVERHCLWGNMQTGVVIMSSTAADLSEEELKRYRPFQNARKPSLSLEAKKIAERVARELGTQYGARKVFLFGSLARGDQGAIFDIDLAVEGLPAARFFEAVAFATSEGREWRIDLVDVDDCVGSLRDMIEKEGIVLWPAKGQSSHLE